MQFLGLSKSVLIVVLVSVLSVNSMPWELPENSWEEDPTKPVIIGNKKLTISWIVDCKATLRDTPLKVGNLTLPQIECPSCGSKCWDKENGGWDLRSTPPGHGPRLR